MVVVYRTDGPWGTGIGEDLDPEQVDNNFWEVFQAILEKAAQGVGISNIVVNGSSMTFVLTDHSLLGPYDLPIAGISFKGEWLANHEYIRNDIITQGGSTYQVLVDHISNPVFDPGDNNGLGQNYYGLALTNPANVLPVGGAVGTFLRKASTTDYDFQPETAGLFELSDVEIISPPPVDGEVLTYLDGAWRSSAAASALSQLSDVSLLDSPPPVAGEVLTFDGLIWTNIAPTGFAPALDTPVAGELLVYDGSFWTNQKTANIPVFSLGGQFGTITIDYALGAVQRVTMVGDTILDDVIGWPPAGQFGRLLLEITNGGAFTWQWPADFTWSGGDIPEISISGRDIYALTTLDGGTVISGSVIGKNYL